MNRNIILLVIIFLILPYISYSLTTFVVEETEKISLVPNASDPDNDRLVQQFEPPLNQNGEWQTNYGDAGQYKSRITVSDGEATASEEFLIIVRKKEEPPVIELYSPKEDPVVTEESKSVNFAVSASDLNKDPLTYEWNLDGKYAKDGQDFVYAPTYSDSGFHKVSITVSDGFSNVTREWRVEVADVDLGQLLDRIPDITLNENEIARLELPDFQEYGLSYTISEPIGNDNEWHTTYGDSGTYDVKIHAEGRGFSGDESVKVTVNDIDRPPVFEAVENKVANEGQEVKIKLAASDPDGDFTELSVDKLPDGATFEDGTFAWTPGHDAVKKSDFVDRVFEKFSVLSKNYYIQFTASSKDKKVVQNAVITVRDVNRPPVMEDIVPITVSEGQEITIVPKAYDPDGDKVKLSYSGFMSSANYRTNYDDAGEYIVKVTASDGYSETSKDADIKVQQTNRPPIFRKMGDVKIKEGDERVILLDATDQDGDELKYDAENPPEGSRMDENAFFWKPDYDTAKNNEVKRIDLVFTVTDGKSTAMQTAKIEVEDKNRPPRIINSSKNVAGNANEPVFMFVRAVDDDGDQLTYTWDFGLLEKYKATSNHQRVFTSPGPKLVKVIVSDGTNEVEESIIVFINDGPQGLDGSVSMSSGKLNITVKRTRTFNATYYPVKTEPGAQIQQYPAQGNRAPRILNASGNLASRVNEPVFMFVRAVDDDGDQLAYTWDFGAFDKHSGSQNHQRTFVSSGMKPVKVTVSDGKYSVVHSFNVNVA